jgi:hypothetical protein
MASGFNRAETTVQRMDTISDNKADDMDRLDTFISQNRVNRAETQVRRLDTIAESVI